MRTFRDFDLELAEWSADAAGRETFRVRVLTSPAGEQRREQSALGVFDAALRARVTALARRELDAAATVELGRALGDLLLPSAARDLWRRSVAALGEGEGLRLRLKLDAWALVGLPWELAWLPPAAEEGAAAEVGAAGFLALDERHSVVRYELLAEPGGTLVPVGAKALRVVALFASLTDPAWPPLALAEEAAGLRRALGERDDVELDVREGGGRADLEAGLAEGAHVFHFGGHGRFVTTLGERAGTVEGEGFLELRAADGSADEVAADALVVNLRGRGVRLAVLGACEGAARDAVHPWSGVAPALVRGGLPAVVAMQATLRDDDALAFGAAFYGLLASGAVIDAAVTAGRRAIFNRGGAAERDWCAPALYLRAASGVLFPREELDAPRPLRARAWTNAGLGAAAALLAALAFFLAAHPRIPEGWLWGSGLSLAGLFFGAPASWLLFVAGDDVKLGARRLLRRRTTTFVLLGAVAALAVAGAALWRLRPAVLRVVPGTRLVGALALPGRPPRPSPYRLRVWLGARDGPPHEIADLRSAGAVLGCSPRVARTLLGRAAERIDAVLRAYLAERVPEEARGDFDTAWRWNDEVEAAPRLRAGAVPSFELVHEGGVEPLESALRTERFDSLGESVTLVILETSHVQR